MPDRSCVQQPARHPVLVRHGRSPRRCVDAIGGPIDSRVPEGRLSAEATGILGGLEERIDVRPGVSVIVCCHNSSRLLPETLAHLSRQVVAPHVSWEVVVVDNGSTDGTGTLALPVWDRAAQPAPLTVVTETRLGLGFARAAGIACARYEYLAFVDDDNWTAPDWVQAVFDLFRTHPDVGVLGSVVTPVFESPRPAWFDMVANLYAIGAASGPLGDVTREVVPCGAGLCLRRAALVDAQAMGLQTISVDRRGTQLSAGGDSEVVLCLRLAGWRVWLDPRLQVRHFLPSRRLDWTHARTLAYWSAHATPERDALLNACKPPRVGLLNLARRLRETWAWQCAAAACRLVLVPVPLLKACGGRRFEGDPEVIHVDMLRGRLAGLLSGRAWYGRRGLDVRRAMGSAPGPDAAARRLAGEVVGA